MKKALDPEKENRDFDDPDLTGGWGGDCANCACKGMACDCGGCVLSGGQNICCNCD